MEEARMDRFSSGIPLTLEDTDAKSSLIQIRFFSLQRVSMIPLNMEVVLHFSGYI